MKIVNRTQFLQMPPGTVFSKYKPCVFGDLCIKDETQGNDFLYQQIVDALDMEKGEEFRVACARAEYTNVPLDFDGLSRDGLYDEEQLFAVWSFEDVYDLIRCFIRACCRVEPLAATDW